MSESTATAARAAERLRHRALNLLIGRDGPQSPDEGVALLRRLVGEGDAEATAQMATMLAAGAWMPRDWPAAFDHLQLAAERGSLRAQEQLILLSPDAELAASAAEDRAQTSPWRALRQGLDVEGWRVAPARRPVCEAPRIRVVEAFTTPAICRWLVGRSLGKFTPALMFDGKKANFSADRTNSDFAFDIVEADLVILLVRERVSALTRLPVFAMEPPQIFHYATGQEIKAHYDHVRAQGGYEAERIATFLLYLNDDFEGGELEFPKIGFRHRGRTGDGIFFANVDTQGAPDMLSLHAALPVTSGEKFILSQWIQDRTFGSSLST